ncbi:unnamed protein product, partial [Didymodactylos carnosus]
TFGLDGPCETVHFQKTRLVFHKAEDDIFIAMTLFVPSLERKKDDRLITEYYDDSINDRLMMPILKLSHRYFMLLHGTISVYLLSGALEELKIVLKNHFDRFIETRLLSAIQNATIDSSYYGIPFLPVERKMYLRVQSLLRRLELEFCSLNEAMFLYKDQLLWSGLEQDDTNIVYAFFRLYHWSYLKNTPLNSSPQFLIANANDISPNETIITNTPPPSNSQKLYLGNPPVSHRVIILHLNYITIYFFLNGN